MWTISATIASIFSPSLASTAIPSSFASPLPLSLRRSFRPRPLSERLIELDSERLLDRRRRECRRRRSRRSRDRDEVLRRRSLSRDRDRDPDRDRRRRSLSSSRSRLRCCLDRSLREPSSRLPRASSRR